MKAFQPETLGRRVIDNIQNTMWPHDARTGNEMMSGERWQELSAQRDSLSY